MVKVGDKVKVLSTLNLDNGEYLTKDNIYDVVDVVGNLTFILDDNNEEVMIAADEWNSIEIYN